MIHELVAPWRSALSNLLAPALLEKVVLWVNHVLRAEPMAISRLTPHVGRCVRIEPRQISPLLQAALPIVPVLLFRITPAGMIEWAGGEVPLPDDDLLVSFDMSGPARFAMKCLQGEMPALDVQGDAGLATDINWLVQNLRWDVEDDLERVFGPVVSHEVVRVSAGLVAALRAWVPEGARPGDAGDSVAAR